MAKKEHTPATGDSVPTDDSDEVQSQIQFIQSVAEMMPDLVSVVEIPSRKIVYANRDMMLLLGFNTTEISNMSDDQRTSLFHPQDLPVIQAFYERFNHLQDGQVNKVEYRLQSKSGQWITLSLRGKVFSRNANGNINQALFIGQDITERKFTEQRLQQLENQRRKELFQVILRTQEVERGRISESLHNGLGQLLYGVKLSLAHLLSDQVLPHTENFLKEKQYTDELLNKAIEETRKISHELMPTMLQGHGLRSAIMDVCKQMSEGIKLDCSLLGLSQKLDEYVELAVYRIIQELLVNIMRHAEASMATLKLKVSKRKIFIEVSDNGKGMDTVQQIKPGIGLASIRNKVDLLNGSIKIMPAQVKGTLIRISIPLSDHTLGVIQN